MHQKTPLYDKLSGVRQTPMYPTCALSNINQPSPPEFPLWIFPVILCEVSTS